MLLCNTVLFLAKCLFNCIIKLYCSYAYNRKVKYDFFLISIECIGDFLMWLDFAKKCYDSSVNKKVLLLCNEKFEQLAINLPYFDKVLAINVELCNRSWFARISLYKKMAIFEFDKVVSTMTRYSIVDQIIYQAFSSSKYGYINASYVASMLQKRVVNNWYTDLYPFPDHVCNNMIIQSNFIRLFLDEKYFPDLPFYPYLYVKDSSLPNNYCVFFLSASDRKRAWSPFNYSVLANNMKQVLPIVLLGAGEEDLIVSDIFIQNTTREVINLVNKKNLIESLNIVHFAKFVVGNDSAGIHMAVVARTMSICVAAGGDFGGCVPYPRFLSDPQYHPKVVFNKMSCFRCKYKCIKEIYNEMYECVHLIKPQDVITEVNNL